MTNSEDQKISILGRVLCLEMLLFLAGLGSLASGFLTGEPMQLFWGGMIITGSVVLYFVRKKDWKKHWEEQERMQMLYQQRQQEMKEKKEKQDDVNP
jgi:hypothetical protein